MISHGGVYWMETVRFEGPPGSGDAVRVGSVSVFFGQRETAPEGVADRAAAAMSPWRRSIESRRLAGLENTRAAGSRRTWRCRTGDRSAHHPEWAVRPDVRLEKAGGCGRIPASSARRLRAAWTRAACRPTRCPPGAMGDERRRCGRSIGCQKKGRRRPLPESGAGKHRGRRVQPVSSPQFFGNHSGVRATCENPGRTPRYKSLTFEWVSDGSGGRVCRLHLGSRHRAGAGVSHSARLVRDSMSCLGVEAKNTKEWRPE